jgi:IclR family acetate operon transcriptional repressor
LGKVLAANQPQADVEAWLQTHELIPRTPNTITTADAFLAEIEATRQRGYGIDNAERSLSIRCIAAPICNAYGKVIAAISVAGPAERMPFPLIDSQMAYLALETAQKISTALGTPALPANGTHRNEEVSQ